MSKIFIKGGEAIAEAAVRAGCRFFAGYPITPQNEIPEYLARRMKDEDVRGVFIQGESEIASINMVFGAALSGTRCMTSSAACGIALKTEGIAYLAAARLPAVICSVSRGGPGLGSIQPAQADYFQATKAAGNGGFRMLVFAPATLQETVDVVYQAFDYADKYRNPVMVLVDGVVSTMMDPVEMPAMKSAEEVAAIREGKSWRLSGKTPDRAKNFISGGAEEADNIEAAAMYEQWKQTEVQYESYMTEDAEVILTGYGTSGRIARSVVRELREKGEKIGLIRPITLYPFPVEAYEALDYGKVKEILDIEMSIPAQMVEDVAAVVRGRANISTSLRSGGQVIGRDQVLRDAIALCAKVKEAK